MAINQFLLKKFYLKLLSANLPPFYPGGDELNSWYYWKMDDIMTFKSWHISVPDIDWKWLISAGWWLNIYSNELKDGTGDLRLAELHAGLCMAGIILCAHLANERQGYTVTPSLIGWAHTQNDPWCCTVDGALTCHFVLPTPVDKVDSLAPWQNGQPFCWKHFEIQFLKWKSWTANRLSLQ